MRLFVAADLPAAVGDALKSNLADLCQAGIDARLASPENLHATLAFIGEYPPEELAAVKDALRQAASRVTAFEVELDMYGSFGAAGNAVLWQGFADESGLEELAFEVRSALDQAGIPFDGKPFAAHVTLARHFAGDVEKLEAPWSDEGRVQSITLYQSTLTPEGATYEALERFELQRAYEHPEGRLLLIDADACPVAKEALAEARQACIPVLLVGNGTQNLSKHLAKNDPRQPKQGFWAATMNVAGGADIADFQIATIVRAEDVVVTQDIGVAAMALGADAAAIGVRGRIYTKQAIDTMLLVRHEEKKVRRQGGRTEGPAAFTQEDRARFSRNLRQLLKADKGTEDLS